MTLAQGDRLGRYEVLGPIGAGGMGEVWRARDTELGRQVAVKVLPEAVASEPRRVERFRREARALAALSHPNLLEVHDVGSVDGLDYVVTELLEGDSLRAAIPPSGLPWKKVAEIGAAAAEGLAAAHGRGIIHRDLKPENLFLTADGRVKILDFGLASMDDEPGVDGDSPTVTEDGAVLGTAGYMAPEQLRGQPATAQSDIFSLGCVMYEMASGRRAFSGNTGAELYAAILKEEPAQLSSSGATVPVDLERIVHRCLEKRPEARSQSAADLAHSLKSLGSSPSAQVMATPSGARSFDGRRWRWWQVAIGALLMAIAAGIAWRSLDLGGDEAPVEVATTLEPNRIAVIPFANRTGDPSLDGLASMTADRLIQGLSELQEIVVAPVSVVAAASTGVESALVVGEVATRTDSGLVLTGVWDEVGAGLELQATLEDTREGTVVRAFDPIPSTRDDPLGAIATLRDWTLMAVQDHLHPILAWGAGERFPDYDAYLMFRRYFETLTSDGSGTAMEAIRLTFRSVEIDPDFIRPRIQRGGNWMPGLIHSIHDAGLAFYLPVRDMELTPYQQRLVAMIDSRIEGRWENAYRLAQDEYEQNPNDTWQRIQLMFCASFVNRPGQTVELFDWSVFDPLTPDIVRFAVVTEVLTAYHRLGRHAEELALAREFAAAGPTTSTGGSTHALELRALAAEGRMDEIDAILTEVMLERDAAISTDGDEMLAVAHELKAHGFREEAQGLAERTVAWYEEQTASSPAQRCDGCMVSALRAAGRHDEACSQVDGLVTDKPEARGYVKEAGMCAARRGDRATAIEMETRIGEIGDRMGPTGVPYGSRGTTHILQAGIATGLGDRDRAIKLIQQAIAAGYADYEWLHVNPDFEPLWDDPEFQEILRPKG